MTPQEFMAQTLASLSPQQQADIDARSDAMVHTAKVFERVLADQLTGITQLRETQDGMFMLTRVAGVIAAERLRCAALGCPPPSWQEALEHHDVLVPATIAWIEHKFKQEVMNS